MSCRPISINDAGATCTVCFICLEVLSTTTVTRLVPIHRLNSTPSIAASQLLNRFYPARTITVTSRDPSYMTPVIKAKLRRKNGLHRAGRIDEANALAQRIGKEIANRNRTRLSCISSKTCVKTCGKRLGSILVADRTSEWWMVMVSLQSHSTVTMQTFQLTLHSLPAAATV